MSIFILKCHLMLNFAIRGLYIRRATWPGAGATKPDLSIRRIAAPAAP
jgi:hypothetical protein